MLHNRYDAWLRAAFRMPPAPTRASRCGLELPLSGRGAAHSRALFSPLALVSPRHGKSLVIKNRTFPALGVAVCRAKQTNVKQRSGLARAPAASASYLMAVIAGDDRERRLCCTASRPERHKGTKRCICFRAHILLRRT